MFPLLVSSGKFYHSQGLQERKTGQHMGQTLNRFYHSQGLQERKSERVVYFLSMQQFPEWFVYILRCADDTLYTGCTNNLEKRVVSHNRGTAARYTRVRLPVTVVYTETCENRSVAQKREAAIKKMNRVEKLQLFQHNSPVSR